MFDNGFRRDAFGGGFNRKRSGFRIIPFVILAFIVLCFVVPIATVASNEDFTSIAGFDSMWSELKGSLIGNDYEIAFYDNYGARCLTMNGDKIDIDGNYTVDEGMSTDYTSYTLSSVITITIDGKEVESCGDTVIFAGGGLEAVVDFSLNETISSSGDGITSLTSVGKVVNNYKNFFGKERVVIIKSQLGVPICAFEGNDVYWEIPSDLPKMTKLMIDGKPLYIHRANFQIIDKELIEQDL